MKRYILLSYTGTDITPETISTLGSILQASDVTREPVHGICMDESEVCSILAKHAFHDAPRELSPVESACIYAEKRFGHYFGNGLKLTLAVSEAVINDPKDETLVNCIDILSRGVSTRIGAQYRITKEVISVFKQINQNLKDA